MKQIAHSIYWPTSTRVDKVMGSFIIGCVDEPLTFDAEAIVVIGGKGTQAR